MLYVVRSHRGAECANLQKPMSGRPIMGDSVFALNHAHQVSSGGGPLDEHMGVNQYMTEVCGDN